jgi:hypothetical protein
MSDTQIAALCGFANQMAKHVYNLASGVAPGPEVEVNCGLLSEMLKCALVSFQDCAPLKKLFPSNTFITTESTYSSVFQFSSQMRTFPFFIASMMRNITASERSGSCEKSSECGVSFV